MLASSSNDNQSSLGPSSQWISLEKLGELDTLLTESKSIEMRIFETLKILDKEMKKSHISNKIITTFFVENYPFMSAVKLKKVEDYLLDKMLVNDNDFYIDQAKVSSRFSKKLAEAANDCGSELAVDSGEYKVILNEVKAGMMLKKVNSFKTIILSNLLVLIF